MVVHHNRLYDYRQIADAQGLHIQDAHFLVTLLGSPVIHANSTAQS